MTGLERIRQSRKISRRELVELLYRDKYIISATTIYNHERGKHIERETLERCARVLGVPVGKLL